jgi:hypothetical protein
MLTAPMKRRIASATLRTFIAIPAVVCGVGSGALDFGLKKLSRGGDEPFLPMKTPMRCGRALI